MRKCPKSIDKPFLILGLEIEEMCVLIFCFYSLATMTYLYIAFVFICFAWIFFLHIKKGKPQGALIHFFYKRGLPLEGLIKPVKTGQRFSLFSKNNGKPNRRFNP